MSKNFLLLPLVMIFSACSSTHPPNRFSEFQISSLRSGDSSVEKENLRNRFDEIQARYDDTFNSCTKIIKEARQEFTGQRSVSIGIATIGIVAGSIIVPALAAKASASKAAIAGWGGVSGAANAGQYMLDSNGFSPFQAADVYEQMRLEVKKAMDSYSSGLTPDAKEAAVNSLFIACQFKPLPSVKVPPATG